MTLAGGKIVTRYMRHTEILIAGAFGGLLIGAMTGWLRRLRLSLLAEPAASGI